MTAPEPTAELNERFRDALREAVAMVEYDRLNAEYRGETLADLMGDIS